MLKRFLLTFFIFGTAFVSNYSMERKPIQPSPSPLDLNSNYSQFHEKPENLLLDDGTCSLEKLSKEVTSPIAMLQSDYTIKDLPAIIKSLEIDKQQYTWGEIFRRTQTLKLAISQTLQLLLTRLRIPFNTEENFRETIHFLSESIVSAHEKDLYSLQNIVCTCIYFERALRKMSKPESNYQKYFGNPQKAIRNLLECFTGAGITAIKSNSELELDMYDFIPFYNPTILFAKEELKKFNALPGMSITNKEKLKNLISPILNPILKKITLNFLKLINSEIYIDPEKDFLPLVIRILHTTNHINDECTAAASYVIKAMHLTGTALTYGELAEEDLTDSDNWSQTDDNDDDEFEKLLDLTI